MAEINNSLLMKNSSSWSIPVTAETEGSRIPVVVITVLISCAVIILNIPATFTVLFTKIKTTNIKHFHILCLSITDIMVGISMMILAINLLDQKKTQTYWKCVTYYSLFTVCIYNSMLQIAAICGYRFYLLATARKPTVFTLKVTLCLTVGISTMCGTVPYVILAPNHKLETCSIDDIFQNNIGIFCLFTSIAGLAMQTITVIFCFLLIHIVYKHKKKVNAVAPNLAILQISDPQRRLWERGYNYPKEYRIIRTICIIVAFLIIFITPVIFALLLEGIKLNGRNTKSLRNALLGVASLNSAINPVVYCFCIPEMKKAFRSFILIVRPYNCFTVKM